MFVEIVAIFPIDLVENNTINLTYFSSSVMVVLKGLDAMLRISYEGF